MVDQDDGCDLIDEAGDEEVPHQESKIAGPSDMSDDTALAAKKTADFKFPVHLQTSTASKIIIAYFPMGTSEVHPHERISAVTKNNLDERVRCEIKDSIIHGRDETAEGIPIDYQMMWESSPAPTDTFRNDYYMFKKDGKMFLQPAKVVHMRSVIEPKGKGQEAKGFLSQSIHHGSSNSNPIGKWVPHSVVDESPEDFLTADTNKILPRSTAQEPSPTAAGHPDVIKAALSMGGGSVDLATDSTALLATAKAVAAIPELAQVFKNGRIQRTSNIMKSLGNKSQDSVIEALKASAFLIQGNWVGQGSIFFRDVDKPGVISMKVCFDYLLSFFARSPKVDSSLPNARLKVKATLLNQLLSMFAKHQKGNMWELLLEPDFEFMRTHPDLVRSQEKMWEEYRVRLERRIEEFHSAKPSANSSAPAAASKPAESEFAAPAAVKRKIGDSTLAQTDKKPVKTVTASRAAPTRRGASSGRGGGRNR